MLFWIFVIMFIVGLIIAASDYNYSYDWLSGGLIVVGGIIGTLMAIFLLLNFTSMQGEIIQKRETLKALEYKIESKLYTDKLDLSDKDIVDEILVCDCAIK